MTNEDSHESEKGIDLIKSYDYEINNNGTLEQLYNKVDNIIKNFIKT